MSSRSVCGLIILPWVCVQFYTYPFCVSNVEQGKKKKVKNWEASRICSACKLPIQHATSSWMPAEDVSLLGQKQRILLLTTWGES